MIHFASLQFYRVALVIFLLCMAHCRFSSGQAKVAKEIPNHQLWTKVLQQYVAENGNVKYRELKENTKALDKYLSQLKSGVPAENWSREEKLAYWINAYNAFTVKLILENYPLQSIKDLNPEVAIPKVNTIWDKDFIKLGGQNFTLNDIEHEILRKQFEEPRIHFAINCASKSCPVLRQEAYTAPELDRQLTDQAKRFLNDPQKNKITKDKIRISKIFSWFSEDFEKNGNIILFLNQYSPVQINAGAEINFMDYDWSLNE